MATMLKSKLTESLADLKNYVLKDIRALSEEQFVQAPAPNTRRPIDFMYETAEVNKMLAKRIRREEVIRTPQEGWMVAPEGFKTKAQAEEAISASIDELLAAVEPMTEEQMHDMVPTSQGDTPIWDLLMFASFHTIYHDGQLTYVQQIHGDMKMHWME